MSTPPLEPRSPVTGMRKFAAAVVGLLIGVLVAVVVVLVLTVIRTEGLAESNQERLANQTKGTAEALDILCKLKKYDLTTGLPALKARRQRGSAEYDPARALVLEHALLLVLSIPSAPSCLASAPATPRARTKAKPKTGRPLLRELESGGTGSAPALALPPAAQPRIEREATAPHRRGSSAPAPRPVRPRPRRPSSRTPPRTTTTTPTIAPAAPAPVATPASPAPAPSPPAATTPTTPAPPSPPPGHGGEPPGQQKKHGPLGICIEALGVEVLC